MRRRDASGAAAGCRTARWRRTCRMLRERRHRARRSGRGARHSYVSPVLTAHPTEVQRKSILDAERAIAELLAARDDLRDASASARRERRAPARASRSCGRRACCASQADGRRRDRERAQLLPRHLPAPDPAALRRARGGAARPRASRRFFRMGNWIGGDRDGNPNVERRDAEDGACAAERDRAAPLPDRGARARRRAVDVATRWWAARRRCTRWPTRSGDASEHREDEPYRRALIGMYARAGRDAAGAHRHRGAAPCGGAERALRDADEFLADLRIDRGVAAGPPRRGAGRAAAGAR